MLANLNALGRFTPDKNEADATLISSYAAVRASQLGVAPEEFFQKHLLSVVAEQIGGKSFDQSHKGFFRLFDAAGRVDAVSGIRRMSDEEVKRAEDEFLSHFPEGSRYPHDTRLLERIRRASEGATLELGGSPEAKRIHAGALGPFSEYATRGVVLPGDSFEPHGRLEVHVYGREQAQQGFAGEPALTFTVGPDGGLTVNGPAPSGDTFREFHTRGWAERAVGHDGTPQEGWSALRDPENPGKAMPLPQMLPLLADVHARARLWLKQDRIGLHWTRATGALGGLFGDNPTAVFFQGSGAGNQSVPRAYGFAQTETEAFNPGSQYDQAQRQFAETERAYGGRDAFEQAKAVGRTKLNYRQWVQVRTPSFRAWFGDWELAAQTLRPAANFAEAREVAKEFQGKTLTSADGLAAVVSRGNLDKMLSASAVHKSESAAEHALAVANLDVLFAQAMSGWSKTDRGGDPNIAAIHRLFAPMRVGNKARLVKLTVKEYAQKTHGNRIYSVEAVNVGEASPVPEMVAADRTEGSRLLTGPTGLADTIAQRVREFNPASVSKVTDPETGEPMVVYHGTKPHYDPDTESWTTPESSEGVLPTYVETSDGIPLRSALFTSTDSRVAAAYSQAPFSRDVDDVGGYGNGSVVYPLFLNIRKPAWRNFDGKSWRALGGHGFIEANAREARKTGWDGLHLRDVVDNGNSQEIVADTWAVFRPEQIKSATGNSGAFDAASPNILKQGNRGAFDPDTNTIALLTKADLSTFLHESGHYFFETDIAVAAELIAKAEPLTPGEAQILADVQALLAWHGIQGSIGAQLDQWYAMDFEERRSHHERTAEAFMRDFRICWLGYHLCWRARREVEWRQAE